MIIRNPLLYQVTSDLDYQPFLADVSNLLEHALETNKGRELNLLPFSEAKYFDYV